MDRKGIDVSSWQGTIDWNSVKKSGIEFAILRSSFGSPSPSQVDNQFYHNVKGAQAAGIPIGAYHYGYAVTEEEARKEAGFFLDTVKDIKFEYPLYYDVEDNGTMGTLGRDALTRVIRAFCETVEQAGYYAGIYASLYWLNNKFYPDKLPYDVWAAQYYSVDQYEGHHGMWQYTSTGKVGGIAGNVDMNIAYEDFPALIKEKGLNGWEKEDSGGSPQKPADSRLGIGHCTADLLNVRSGPGTENPVLFQIAEGNVVDVLKTDENGWLQIHCLHGTGWCSGEYIQWSPFSTQVPPIGVGKCTADVLNVRTGNGLSYPVVFQIARGNMVNVLISNGDWLQIDCLHGTGWCASEYIDWYRTQVQVPFIGVGSCTADLLNVRTGPDTSLSVVFQLAEGNMVDVLEDNGQGWLKIRCLHGTGWCSGQYISWHRTNQ